MAVGDPAEGRASVRKDGQGRAAGILGLPFLSLRWTGGVGLGARPGAHDAGWALGWRLLPLPEARLVRDIGLCPIASL